MAEREQGSEELMAGAKGDDPRSFDRLVHRYRDTLFRRFRGSGLDGPSADDCVQETFLRLFKARQNYEPRAPFRAFLFMVARHVHVDWLRKHRAPRELEDRECPTDPIAARTQTLDLAAAVARLPAAQREVVRLSLHGRSYGEIAAALGIPRGTVKSRMYHAVRRLRDGLGHD